MANSTKPRKKYHQGRAQACQQKRTIKRANRILRQDMTGITISYNSSWGNNEDFCGCNYERLIKRLNGCEPTAYGLSVQMRVRWRVYITINCVSQDGEEYAYTLPVIDREDSMRNLEAEIEHKIIPAALAKRNQAHIKDWRYLAEILG